MSLKLYFGILGCLLTLIFAGCGGSETDVAKANREGMFLINNGAEPSELDPHVVTGITENRVIKSLIEGLVTEHPTQSDEVSPGMALDWDSNADKSVWTFHLREAFWSNGDPVQASDFVYAYSRILNPELAAQYAGMLYGMEGAEAFSKGEISDFSKVGVKAIDEKTLEIRLVGPTPYFPLLLSHYTWFPIHPPTIEKFGAFGTRGSGWTLPENFVGNGPFLLEEWSPNQRIVVKKNPNYWDAETVSLSGITFFPVQDRQTENRMFQTGQIHKTNGLPFNLRDKFRKEGNPALREDPMFATGYLGLNMVNPGLDDVRVREAISLAINREQIIEKVTKNGERATGFVPPGISGYPVAEAIDYNPELARELLAEAGYPNGKGFPLLNFIIVNTDTSRIFAEVLQSMLRDELGIEVQINNKEWRVLLAEMDSGNFDIFLLSWIGDYMDPATFLKIMKSGDGNNRTGFSDIEFDRLLNAASQTADLSERYLLLSQAEKRLMTAKPILPINWSKNMYLIDPEIEGWAAKRLMDQPYKYVRLAREQ